MGIVSDGSDDKAFMSRKTLKALAGENLCTHLVTQG